MLPRSYGGDDLIPSTYRQLAIYEALGWQPPSMVHVPLVVGPDGRRLAKRHGDTRLATLREAGILPETLLGYFAWCHGWIDSDRPITAQQLLGIADLSCIPRRPCALKSKMPFDIFANFKTVPGSQVTSSLVPNHHFCHAATRLPLMFEDNPQSSTSNRRERGCVPAIALWSGWR